MHAEVAVAALDRARLEHLCRYVCRPPIAQERLEETASGKLRYTLKRPWRDGTVALVIEPLDLLARVCALIPPPRFHMVHYHGVLSSHAKVRAEVLPRVEDLPVQLPLFKQDRGADRDLEVLAPEPRKKSRAWLLRHVFEIDVSTCPRGGGATRWLEAATKPEAIARLLAKHNLGPRPPPRASPKGQLRLGEAEVVLPPDEVRPQVRHDSRDALTSAPARHFAHAVLHRPQGLRRDGLLSAGLAPARSRPCWAHNEEGGRDLRPPFAHRRNGRAV